MDEEGRFGILSDHAVIAAQAQAPALRRETLAGTMSRNELAVMPPQLGILSADMEWKTPS